SNPISQCIVKPYMHFVVKGGFDSLNILLFVPSELTGFHSSRAEKERQGISSELNDIRSAMDQLSNEKAGQEKLNKQWQASLGDIQAKYEEAARTFQELEGGKKKLAIENSELSRALEDSETQIATLNKLKISLASQLEDVKRVA